MNLFCTQRGIHEIHEPDVLIADPFYALPGSARRVEALKGFFIAALVRR